MPVVSRHLPGIANGVGDSLSRFHQPEKAAVVPAFMKDVPRLQQLQPRMRCFYSSLAGPTAEQNAEIGSDADSAKH